MRHPGPDTFIEVVEFSAPGVVLSVTGAFYTRIEQLAKKEGALRLSRDRISSAAALRMHVGIKSGTELQRLYHTPSK